jgi:hypothetical protein
VNSLAKPVRYALLSAVIVFVSLFQNGTKGPTLSNKGTQAFFIANEYHFPGKSTIGYTLTVPAACINGCSYQGSGKVNPGIDAIEYSSHKYKTGENLFRLAGTSIQSFSQESSRRYLVLMVMRI